MGRKTELAELNSDLIEFLTSLRDLIDAQLQELEVEDDPGTDDLQTIDDED